MARQSPQRTNPLSTGTRHRRYRLSGVPAALILLGGAAFLGATQGDWILFDGTALYLLIVVALNATDSPSRQPPVAPPDPTPDTSADMEGAPTQVPVAVSSRPAARPRDGAPGEPPPP